jgi:alpha-tubulin suppressor-like RCC1 family protein
MPDSPITNFKDSNNVDLGKKLVTKDYLLEVYGTILENSPASGLIVTPELWGWGNDGSLGINSNDGRTKSTPVTTFAGGTNWKQVSAGDHTMVIKTDGTLWGWGSNDRGNIGTNNTGGKNTPVTTFAGGTDWKSVACGQKHTAAIKTDGSLWIWGNNDQGQLGINDNINRSTPVTTFAGGNTWKSVSCGGYAVTAIKTDGTLWIWGLNAANLSLGINASGNRSTPVTTFAGGNNWKQVSGGGNNHTTAIKTDGSLWTWGRGNEGQLGTGNPDNKNIPVTTFTGGTTWKSVVCGGYHTAAIKTDGSLWVWGLGTNGRLGTNDTITRSFPVTTFAGGTNWKSVSVSQLGNTTAIKTDGTLWVWGDNGQGRLGTNNTITRSTPVTTFAGGNNWKQVFGSRSHTVAIQTIDYI